MNEAVDSLGSMATAGLIAREIERAHDGRPALGHSDTEPCANCETMRTGPYCHACGQAGHVHRNLGALVHDVAHGVFHFEGKMWTTLPLLAWRPGELTHRYVHGERAKFVSPMALFLFSAFLMFAVVSSLAGHGEAKLSNGAAQAKLRTELAQMEAQRARTATVQDRAVLDKTIAVSRRALATIEAADAGRPGADRRAAEIITQDTVNDLNVNTGWHWLDGLVSHAGRNPELLLYKMKSYAYKYSWALIPISLPFIWLLFAFRRDVGLYDHAIFSIYSLAFMSLGVVVLTLLSAIGLPTGFIVVASLIIPPLHIYRQLKGAYRLGRLGALWRTCAMLIVTSITLSLFLMFLFYLGSD